MISHWHAANELNESATAFVVVTLIASRGHVPQEIGAKAIITENGIYNGTVGGGKVEARAIEHARTFLRVDDAAPQVMTWNLTTDIKMTCGGEVTFLFEKHDPKRWTIALFGAGHVAQAVARTLNNLDCHVMCFDTRDEWIDRLPDSNRLSKRKSADLPAEVAGLHSETFFVVMTQGHATDLPILEQIFRHHPDAPYVGVMGSDVKAKKMRHDLLERGISECQVERLRSPIGLPIGGSRPYEIAISVVAELLQTRK